MERANKIDKEQNLFQVIFESIPQISITMTVVGMTVMISTINPTDIVFLIPIWFVVLTYWILRISICNGRDPKND